MTENDIRGYVSALEGALKADREDVASAAELALLAGFLINVNRIADAIETLAMAKLTVTPSFAPIDDRRATGR